MLRKLLLSLLTVHIHHPVPDASRTVLIQLGPDTSTRSTQIRLCAYIFKWFVTDVNNVDYSLDTFASL